MYEIDIWQHTKVIWDFRIGAKEKKSIHIDWTKLYKLVKILILHLNILVFD